MPAQERINAMKAVMRRCLADDDLMTGARLDLTRQPTTMHVTYHDGPGIQFFDADGVAIFPDLIRDEELAIELWNRITDCAPIDPAWFADKSP